jgi:RimJ/RimL family protein N-acetyltransferase
MSAVVIPTPRLRLVLETTETMLARIEAMSPEDRAQVSPAWLAQLRSAPPSPWTHGFAMVETAREAVVGSCGYKGPPDSDAAVEIAYGVHSEHRGRGLAKEAAAALVDYALAAGARVVRAHTLPALGASTSVLVASGFRKVGEVVDPEDGLVWRWEFVSPDRA